MKMKFSSLLIFFLILSSCSDYTSGRPTPQNLIPRDTVVMVLKDMTLIESHIQTKYLHVSRFQKTMKLSGKKVLDHYSISHKRFEESMEYYGTRQEEMQSIYSQVLDSLNKEASLLSKDVILKDTSLQHIQIEGLKVIPGIKREK
ncbi:MAG: hypothetical protein RI883_439 [Bacteroidota bacterium]